MTEDQIQQCKQNLIELEKENKNLLEEYAASSDTVKLDQSSVGRLSRMDAMQGQQMALEASRRRELQAQKIEGALRRIDQGNFGICFNCEEEIPFPRLAADPTNMRCIKCAE